MRYRLSIDDTGLANAVEDYISLLFKLSKDDNKETIKRLGQFFNEDYLRKLNINAMLSRGDIPSNINDYYNNNEL